MLEVGHGMTATPRHPAKAAALLLWALMVVAASPALAQVDPFAGELPEGWYARIETSLGEILVYLHPDQSPQGVAYFAGLANAELAWTDRVSGETITNHYYDGLIVHRAEAAKRFEAGDPHGLISGGGDAQLPLVGETLRDLRRAPRRGQRRQQQRNQQRDD